MSSNNEGTSGDSPLQVSTPVKMSTAVKISLKDKSGTNLTSLEKQFEKQERKPEQNKIQGVKKYDLDENSELKKESEYLNVSEYIEDETEFEDSSYPQMEIDESIGYEFEGFVHPIHYTDVIEDDINYFDEDSKDVDPDFGLKKKKKKKIPSSALLHTEDQTKKVKKTVKPKILECTDDLTKIDHCEDNPNFAVVVDFIENFGEHLGMKRIPIKELQSMLSDHENEPHSDLIKLHTNLLRKTKLPKKTLITKKTFENALVFFCHTTGDMVEEGLELQKLGYTQISLSLRLEILKNLMESQFDHNERIRMLVDDLPVEALRREPTGTDIEGKIYWTQIDDHAEIRIYTEDCRHDTWGNVVQNRFELVSLLDKLKDEKLYKQEAEKLQLLDADVQDQNAIVDSIKKMEKELELKSLGLNTDYKCEICMIEFGTKTVLMEHYSGGHMAVGLKEKFKHLVENGQCKICKFKSEEENLLWIHIGTFHEKVNSVLKENKLNPIGETVKNFNDEKTNPEISINVRDTPNIQTEDSAALKKLEKKIEELKYQMSEDETENQLMSDMSTDSRVQNNQDSEEVLNRENLDRKGGEEIQKVNQILNLDGITDFEEEELISGDTSEANTKTTKGKTRKIAKEKEDKTETETKGKRGRKRKADMQTVQITKEDINLNKNKESNEAEQIKTDDDQALKKQTKAKNEIGISEQSSLSVERPRRGRACKEFAEVIKVANTPLKKGKEKKSKENNTQIAEVKEVMENKSKKKVKEIKNKIEKEEISEKITKEQKEKNTNRKKGDTTEIVVESKEAKEIESPNTITYGNSEKKKRGRPATPKKGNKRTESETEVQQNFDTSLITQGTMDVMKDTKKKTPRVTAKKQKNTPFANQENLNNDSGVNLTPDDLESNQNNSNGENDKTDITSKKKESVKEPKKKKIKKKDDIQDGIEDQTDNKSETKPQGKRKETDDESEKLTKKKKLEEKDQISKNVRERKSRNTKKPVYEEGEKTDDEDLYTVDSISTAKITNTTKEKKGKKGDADKIKKEDIEEDSKSKIKKTRKRKGTDEKKVIDVAKQMKVKERRENKLSCKKCNQWKGEKELVFSCSSCDQGWHQHCTIPSLYHEPEPEWLCPLCNHIALVKKLEKTLAEFDMLMEKAEERRLADLIENQSRVNDDQYDDLNDYSYAGDAVDINVQVNPPEIKDLMRPNYYESSDEDAPESDDDEWGVRRTKACTCEGDGDCTFCKGMQGCTCDSQGTCRPCMSASDKSSSKLGVSKGPLKMSTTEMFMLTGKKRQVEVGAHEHAPDDGFRYRGTARGRGLPRRMRRGRGGRGMSMGRGQPIITPNIEKSFPPGITISSAPPEKKPLAVLALGIGRSLPPGITVTNSSGKDVSHLAPKPRAPVPELNLPGISLSRAEPAAKVIDVIDLSDSDDEPEIIDAQPITSVVPYQQARPMQARPYGTVQRGPRVPIQRGGMMRPRMPMQQSGRIIVRSGQAGRFPVQRGGIQRGNMVPRRGMSMQRGAPIRRPLNPGQRHIVPGQRGAYPPQRPPISVQRGGVPIQRRFGTPQRPGMPPRRPMMRRPMGRIMPGQMRPRMMRPPQRGMMRGQRPMMRMRGRPIPGRGGPRPVGNLQFAKQDSIVIPTVTQGNNTNIDMDIAADIDISADLDIAADMGIAADTTDLPNDDNGEDSNPDSPEVPT